MGKQCWVEAAAVWIVAMISGSEADEIHRGLDQKEAEARSATSWCRRDLEGGISLDPPTPPRKASRHTSLSAPPQYEFSSFANANSRVIERGVPAPGRPGSDSLPHIGLLGGRRAENPLYQRTIGSVLQHEHWDWQAASTSRVAEVVSSNTPPIIQ